MTDHGYELCIDPGRMDIDTIHGWLAATYWSPGIPRDRVARAVANSHCIGAFHDGRQVGFARAVTDRATFAWIADVYVDAAHRGHGLARRMIREMLCWPDLRGLRRIMLATRDAHALYAGQGFSPVDDASHLMVRRAPAGGDADAGASAMTAPGPPRFPAP